ncbi:acyl-homoserine-lactone synthase [Vibrio sp. 10N.261.46.E12]|uniref:acyl-homoserine-lactone synthase n=1 Tax=unclassified Vibrio TaxID=2614977 RepID=UPI000975F03D|nr:MULTISPECIES: acyl-homoserine-lactone synthase [unclassified Vibrio]OMO36111.1 hypothetical protein BH584_04875 [Vibrio sp. 10N.261.45.E1]PMJ34537.1 hypothetical protein BCU27_03660 [Vibrio sp. 10N.286.45.B6]PML88065.1 hypothetical protein BCT66_10730 [Vibrio sp. 10N.261.49.E11]PMM67393.1 hypothetical protein BCT48_15205 [Vibrio sp. 10N.261.46.F12]PMM81724.1 hypothetical protein BCT46_15055 [Vibrio sp. 10N.261.46.E8]
MKYQSGKVSQLTSQNLHNLFRYRHDVFVKQLGWDLDIENKHLQHKHEVDQYDVEDTVYVYSTNSRDRVTGCARLLPTAYPYLLEEIFPELLDGVNAPKSTDVWELSRFASMDIENEDGGMANQVTSKYSLDLLNNTIDVAREQGAKHLISVSPVAIERMMKKEGVSVKRLGAAKRYGNHLLLACWIDI